MEDENDNSPMLSESDNESTEDGTLTEGIEGNIIGNSGIVLWTVNIDICSGSL